MLEHLQDRSRRSAAMARAGSLCALPGMGGSAGGTTAEFVPLALVAAAFTGAAVWMFRRWGGHDTAGAGEAPAVGDAPGPVADARPVGA